MFKRIVGAIVGALALVLVGVEAWSAREVVLADEIALGWSGDPAVEAERVARRSEVIDRMADGIWRYKTEDGATPWWHCATAYTEEEERAVAQAWAKVIVSTAVDGDRGRINPWGLAGVISRESSWDECAVDFKTRFWAYDNGLLKRPRTHITHSLDEIQAMVQDKRWKQRGKLDAGPGQLRWGSITRLPLATLMTLEPGIGIAADEMRSRAIPNVSIAQRVPPKALTRPWSLWPGRYSEDYDAKITVMARILGSRRGEI
jgi:hypothetical protein